MLYNELLQVRRSIHILQLLIVIHFNCILLDKYHSQFAAGNQYAYYHEGDESSFQLVDTSKPQKTAYQRNRQRFNNVRSLL